MNFAEKSPLSLKQLLRLQELHAWSMRLLGQYGSIRKSERDLLQEGIDTLTALIGACHGTIDLVDETKNHKLCVCAGIAPEQAQKSSHLAGGRGLFGAEFRGGHLLDLDDRVQESRPRGRAPIRSPLVAAVSHDGRVYGHVYLSDKMDGAAFDEYDENFANQFAGALALGLAYHRTQTRLDRLERIFDNSSNEIYVFNAETLHFVQVNHAALRNLGYSMKEMKSLTPLEIAPEFNPASLEAMLEPLRSGKQEAIVFETAHKRKDDSLYPVEVRLHFSRTESPPVFMSIIQDITERRQTEDRLKYMAHYDGLTGLPNRVLLQDRLNIAMGEADYNERLVAVMFLDIDRFKIVNDTLGHDVGDALLKQVAERLKTCVRAGDSISRLGGDEFTIILANVAHVDDVAHVAHKVIDSFKPSFNIGGRELFISPSIGITLYPFDDNNPDNLLRNADAAMYHAKEMGRNTFQFYTAELNHRTAKRLQLETALRHALERHELLLYYQPQVSLETGKIIGAEALLRWQHPEMGLISPMDFIPLAEETGLIIPIGEWVLRTACAQARAWLDAGFDDFQISVNLSGRQLQHRKLAKVVKRVLKETGLVPRQLDLELTESLLMHDTRKTLATMDELHAFGVAFSIDDFGTGYSSLSYLKRFPIDTVKIDQSFVRDIPRDPDDVAIAQAIIAIAHHLGMKVIAEGVETTKQLAFMRSYKCNGIQGYYFSKPVTVGKMTRLLQKDHRLALNEAATRRGKIPRAKN